MNIPETRIIKPGGLYRAVEPFLRIELQKSGQEELIESNFLDAKANEISKAWKPYEKRSLMA